MAYPSSVSNLNKTRNGTGNLTLVASDSNAQASAMQDLGAYVDSSIVSAGATDLGRTLSSTQTVITSSTGTSATIPAADATNAGVMTAAQQIKLAGIATGATANDTDANLKARANHTGTQTASTISDFSTAADARISAAAGVSVASLSGGKIPTSQIPALGLVSVQTASSQAAQLALTTQEGDVVVRTDTSVTYMRNAGVTGTMTDFTLLNTPASPVTSVNSQTGIVVLAKGDVGLGNADNTSDANKPVSTAQQTALNLKANIASPSFTGTVSGITASMVGLGNVDNTSDSTKNAASVTLTNKNLVSTTNAFATVTSVTSSSAPAPTGDSRENELYVTAGTVGMTVSAPSGTPANGNRLLMAFYTASAQTLAFNAAFAPVGVSMPSTTAAGKWTYVGARYNSTASKWHVLAVGQEA